MPHRPRAGVRLVCLLLSSLVLAGCGKAPAPAAASAAIPVTLQTVQPREWNDSLAALGTVKARESVTLTAKVSEIVERVHFESGQEVAAGAPLVTLRGQGQQAALREAEATYTEAEQLYRRQSELVGRQLVSRAQLDTQRALRDAAQARVLQMRAEIGDRSVRAPFAGVLGLRQVSPGALLTPDATIATLDDVAQVYVDFQVPEAALSTVKAGDAVGGRSVAYPGRAFDGKVATVDARVDSATRAVTVRAAFDNADRALRPGMLMDVRLYRPARQALVIPEIAVVQVGRDAFVYRVGVDANVARADVRTGARRDGLVEIVEGLQPGQRIVVEGTGKLRPGVTVVDARSTAAAAPATTGPSPGSGAAERAR
ncbi:efflux transporter periplasmic adaptor subunit [Xanthomonas sontii]|uniref:efflux RND transporter periplasmic adaptor subunit n=1 Tax=Xanthomonas sontii TaxID=2650745 RepID=UPI00123D1125|nr:efflux RND transporter periplasmic adaptor subunit [Xanthomonas sontii]KAA8919732.1 efflux transporter periplasmic adaptor subunit [Xanthomonas sontii]